MNTLIRNIKTKINGVAITPGLLSITPPAINIKRETLLAPIDRSFDAGIEELRPEISLTGMPGRLADFMRRYGGTAPLIEAVIEYSDDTCQDVQNAVIRLQVEIISAQVPVLTVGKIESSPLQLGRCFLYEYQENGIEIYYVESGYNNEPPRFRINGVDSLRNC